MEKIVYKTEVKEYLKDLAFVLFKNEYFSYMETAIEYVQKIRNDIETTIAFKQHKSTPQRLIKHGKYYASFPANKRTTWYVFFDKKGDRFFIEYITNNHLFKASLLIN